MESKRERMEQNTPVEHLDIEGAPVERGVKFQELYNKSKAQDEFFIKEPSFDSPGDDVALLFLEAKRERGKMHKEHQELLQNQANNARINQQLCVLAKKMMNDMRKQFIEVNEFTKECDDKRTLAQLNIGTQLGIQKKLHRAIEAARIDVEQLSAFQKLFADHIKEYDWCHEFMKNILTDSDLFKSEEDCIMRCDGLMQAHLNIVRLHNAKIREIDEMHKFMVKTTKEAAATALGMANKIEGVRREYMQALVDCQRWEKKLEEATSAIINNQCSQNIEISNISNLYRLLCTRIGVTPKFFQAEEQLDFIKNEVEVMKAVLDELERRESQDERRDGPSC